MKYHKNERKIEQRLIGFANCSQRQDVIPLPKLLNNIKNGVGQDN